jgi:hypothetical protein
METACYMLETHYCPEPQYSGDLEQCTFRALELSIATQSLYMGDHVNEEIDPVTALFLETYKSSTTFQG